MDSKSYRKLSSKGSVNVMREFYYDYNRMVRCKAPKNISPSNRIKTCSAVKMSKIINSYNSNTNTNNYVSTNNIIQHQSKDNVTKKSQNLGKSHFFRLRSRKQMQDYQDKVKGQFKDEYSASHNFIRPYLSIEEKETPKINNGQLIEQMKKYHKAAQLQSSHKNLSQLGELKRKIQSAEIVRKQISAKLRYNYLLKNKYKHQTQKHLIYPPENHIQPFYRTKESIFPFSSK